MLGKAPPYDLPGYIYLRCLGIEKYQSVNFNYDRFYRGLEKAYKTGRISLRKALGIISF